MQRTTNPMPLLQLPLLPGPGPAELLAEARRMWLARQWFRRRYRSLAALLACPERRALVLACARCAWLARQRTMR